MTKTAGRAAALVAAAGLLAAGTPAAADAQDRTRLPVAAPGPVHDDARGPGPRPPGDAGRVGLLPLDPDARGLLRRPRRPKSGRLRDRRRLHALSTLFVPIFGHGLRAAGARRPAGEGGRPPGARAPDDPGGPDDGGRASPDDAPDRPPERAEGAGRSAPEGPCLEVSVRMEDGSTHRIRADGAALDADTPAAAERELRERTASRGALVVEGMDGVSLHLGADGVREVSAEGCPTIVVP